MRYARIDNAIVANIIWLYEGNAQEFPDAVKIGDLPVQIGDTYTNGHFFCGGEVLKFPLEQANDTIAALDVEVVDLIYQNIILEFG